MDKDDLINFTGVVVTDAIQKYIRPKFDALKVQLERADAREAKLRLQLENANDEIARLRAAGVRFCDDFVSRFSEPLTDPERAMLRAAAELRAALAPVEAKPCEYLDPPVCIDPSVCVSKCRFHGTVAEPHSALKGGDDGR